MRALPAVLAAALTAGALSGAVAVLALRPTPPDPGRAAPASPAGPEPEGELAARVAALAEENRALRQRVALIENRPAPQRLPAEGLATRDELDALRAEVETWIADLDGPTVEPGVFQEQVAETLAALRKEERVRKVRQDQERRAARLDDDVAKIAEWLQLSGYQSTEMRAALLAQYEREDEVRRLWEEGASDELLGERKEEARASFRADVAAVLDAEQFETFWNRVGGGKD